MAKSLKNNLTSSYLEAANRLASKKSRRRIVAYVESYDDVAFWRSLLSEFEDDEHYFQVMLPSNTSLAKGKKTVLMNTLNTGELGRSLIACVDSDYDYLYQDTNAQSRKINRNPFILQTYAYAIENHQCCAEALHEVCVQSTLNDRMVLDFEAFLKRYSEIVYPLFIWNVWFYRKNDTHSFPMHHLHSITKLPDVNVRHPEEALAAVERAVASKLHKLQKRFGRQMEQVQKMADELKELGVTPPVTYLFMQGHHIMDCVVMKLLTPICTQLRREREADIKRLACHREQFRAELAAYEHSILPPAVVLRRHVEYKGLVQYEQMREDVRKILKR